MKTARSLVFGLLFSLLSVGMQAQSLNDSAEELAIADALMQTAQGSGEKLLAYSKAIQAYETAMITLRASLNATAAERRSLERKLHGDSAGQKRLLSGIMRLSRSATPILALSDEPTDLLQSAMLLERVSISAREKMNVMQADIATLEGLQKIQSGLQNALAGALANLNTGRDGLRKESEISSASMPNTGEDASNLAALAIALEGLPGPVLEPAPATLLKAPVKGIVANTFNTAVTQGIKRPGVIIAAPTGSLVISPDAASVRFAGTLDGYGPVVILEHTAGQLLIFAGFEHLLVRAGANINAGQGIGFLAGEPVLHEEFLEENAKESGETPFESLYIEVRVDGTPVDPGLWFAFDS